MRRIGLTTLALTLPLSIACEAPLDSDAPGGLGDAGDTIQSEDTDDQWETDGDDASDSSGVETGEVDVSESPNRFWVRPRVKVLSFDPIVYGQRLHDHYGWRNPHDMTFAYRDAVRTATSGSVDYQIEQFAIIEEFPNRVDGQQWTEDSYTQCYDNKTNCLNESPYEADIAAYARGFDWCADAKAGVSEIWIFGGARFGMPESQMFGDGAHWLNSTALQVECDTPLVIMMFSYERGIAEMMHNLGHRIESHMDRQFGAWPGGLAASPWTQFRRKRASGEAECGDTHFPPNAWADYAYAESSSVTSGCYRWNNYPDHEFPSIQNISCNTWSCQNDPHLSYMSWWISRLPNRDGVDQEGFQNDWRRYVFDYRRYL